MKERMEEASAEQQERETRMNAVGCANEEPQAKLGR
jgi:hypothetical protein